DRGHRGAELSHAVADAEPGAPSAGVVPVGGIDSAVGPGEEQIQMLGVARDHGYRGADLSDTVADPRPRTPSHRGSPSDQDYGLKHTVVGWTQGFGGTAVRPTCQVARAGREAEKRFVHDRCAVPLHFQVIAFASLQRADRFGTGNLAPAL